MAVVQLNVVRFEQKPGRCGAATAQMILFYKNLIANPAGDQDMLWAQIKANTGGPPLSATADVKATDCPTWLTQQCDRCPGARQFICWCTYPPALLVTLTSYTLPMVMTTPATDEALTASAIASVDFDIPAAVLVQSGLHWIAVAGYETNGTDAQAIGGQMISEIYICDPAVNAGNHNVAIADWLEDFVSPVIQCGIFLNQVVVIAATAPLPAPQGPAPGAPTNIGILRRPHGKRPRKPPRGRVPLPRRPPKPRWPPKKRKRR